MLRKHLILPLFTFSNDNQFVFNYHECGFKRIQCFLHHSYALPRAPHLLCGDREPLQAAPESFTLDPSDLPCFSAIDRDAGLALFLPIPRISHFSKELYFL